MALSAWQVALPALLIVGFGWFFGAGGVSFERSPDDDVGGMLAQISFLITGALGTWVLASRIAVRPVNGAVAAVLLIAALALYEWARRTIRHRGFHIAWSGYVPDALCERGPYAHVRHPIYASYILAFLAMLVALPGIATVAIFLGNAVLFTHASLSDERAIAMSGLADEYAHYRRRAGRFLPRWR